MPSFGYGQQFDGSGWMNPQQQQFGGGQMNPQQLQFLMQLLGWGGGMGGMGGGMGMFQPPGMGDMGMQQPLWGGMTEGINQPPRIPQFQQPPPYQSGWGAVQQMQGSSNPLMQQMAPLLSQQMQPQMGWGGFHGGWSNPQPPMTGGGDTYGSLIGSWQPPQKAY